MAKKRFTDDLSNLFDHPFDEPGSARPDPNAESVSGDHNSDEESIDIDLPVSSSKARKKISSKGFTNSLDSFLSNSFERESGTGGTGQRSNPSGRRRRGGLDLLIRSTVQRDDEDSNPRDAKTVNTKRVTLIFRKDHLVELKELAKDRKMYLKDLVQEMVSGFLDT